MTFALFFGNRGNFPGELIAEAREQMQEACKRNGYDYIILDKDATRLGAVETCLEGEIYAEFLKENEGKYDGVIICLPNFGDENGVTTALRDINVPVLVQAYPDEFGKMCPALRRDAFCGKLAVCNMLRQCDIPFTLTKDFAVSPTSPAFDADLTRFAAVCRTVNGMRKFKIGVFGARTTPFKTTRCDETTLQKKGITVETFDLSEVFEKMNALDQKTVADYTEKLKGYACYNGFAEETAQNQARFIAVLEEYIANYKLSSVAIRCWHEIERAFKIAPCMGMSYLTEKGIPAACETDIASAAMMHAMTLASDQPVMVLDVNNNYGDDNMRCILFHCGVAPASMLKEQPKVCCHRLVNDYVGAVEGNLISGEVTVGNIVTDNGKIHSFIGQGTLTDDPIDSDFFGNASVFYKENLPEMLTYMSRNGYKHHTVVAKGEFADVINEVFTNYLGYENDML